MLALIRAAASHLSVPNTLCWDGIITIFISAQFQTQMRIVDVLATVESQIGTRDQQLSPDLLRANNVDLVTSELFTNLVGKRTIPRYSCILHSAPVMPDMSLRRTTEFGKFEAFKP